MAYISAEIVTYVDDVKWTSTTRSLYAGGTYTPSLYPPSHPSDTELVSIYLYNWSTGSYTNCTTGSITIPSGGCSIDYYYETSTPPTPTWTAASTVALGDISSATTRTISIGSYTINRYSFYLTSQADSVQIYTTGGADTIGYLGTETLLCNLTTGEPIEYDYYDDDSGTGNNFRIECENYTTGMYYLFIKCYQGASASSITLHINPVIPLPEWVVDTTTTINNLSWHWENTSKYFSGGDVYRIGITFATGGMAKFYTQGSSDTYGALSDGTSFDGDSGKPTHILAENDDYQDTNMSFDYFVTAGVRYYFFVRLYDYDDYGTTAIHIEPPAGTYRVWFYHYLEGESEPFDASYASIIGGTQINLYDYRSIEYTDQYFYSYATETGSTTHIDTAVIRGDSLFNLYYTQSTGSYTLIATCNGNCKQVSITANGNTVTSPENGSCRMVIPNGVNVVVNYIGYNSTSSSWYKHMGWFSALSGGGTKYSDDRRYSFAMPASNRTIYCYVVRQSSAFGWTYAGLNSSGNPVSGNRKIQGYGVYMTAQEWNDLWKYVEAIKNTYISHTRAVVGSELTAAMYNEVVSAEGSGSTVQWGQPLSAALLNSLITNA